jgi:hypothetical protein
MQEPVIKALSGVNVPRVFNTVEERVGFEIKSFVAV